MGEPITALTHRWSTWLDMGLHDRRATPLRVAGGAIARLPQTKNTPMRVTHVRHAIKGTDRNFFDFQIVSIRFFFSATEKYQFNLDVEL